MNPSCSEAPKPLRGVKVLEVEAIGPVPWACMVLADLGADVVRIQNPGRQGPDTHGAVLRGRTTVALDLKSPEGHRDFCALAARADVLIEGMRPQVMERLRLGPDELFALNEGLVYARMTGWGQHGPQAQDAGHDINYIAAVGVLDAIGAKDKPAIPLNLIGDFGGGACFLLIGLLAALTQPRASRHRITIDAAMVDGASVLMSLVHARSATGLWQPGRANNALDGGVPWYDTYRTRDGRFVAIGALEDKFYTNLLAALDLADTLPDRDQPQNRNTIRQALEARFLEKTRDEWAAHFAGRDACFSPVLTKEEAPSSPHLRARQSFFDTGAGQMPAPAPVFNGRRFLPAPQSASLSAQNALARWQ